MNNPFIDPVTFLGKTAGRKPNRQFDICRSDRLFHQYIIGQTGTGKSTLLLNMVMQDIERGEGFCLIDPHGDLAEAVAPLLSDDAIYWNPSDPDCEFGYNPLTYVVAEYRPLVASGIIDTLKQQWSDAWGVRMEHLLRFSLLALLERPGSTLADIVPMFTKKHFRSEVLEYVSDHEVLKFWRDEFPNMNYKNSFDGVAPIANKLGAFLSHPNIRKALCSPDQPLRFRKLLDEGTPLVVNLSKGKLGADISNVLGGLVVSMMTHAAYSRSTIPEIRRRPFFLYADEFHSFTTEAFAGMLSELRKYKLGLILSHQHCSQLQRPVLDSILGNVGTMIVFRVGALDAPLIAKQLGQVDPDDLINLPNYYNFTKLMIKGVRSKAFSARTSNLETI